MPHYFSFLKNAQKPRVFGAVNGKKAMEMSLNTVVVAVIALLILGLMIFVLARNTDVFNKGTKCSTYGGRCVTGGCDTCSIITPPNGEQFCNNQETCCSLVPNGGKRVEVDGKSTAIASCNNN